MRNFGMGDFISTFRNKTNISGEQNILAKSSTVSEKGNGNFLRPTMKRFIGVGTDGNIERWWVVVVVFGRENWDKV